MSNKCLRELQRNSIFYTEEMAWVLKMKKILNHSILDELLYKSSKTDSVKEKIFSAGIGSLSKEK